MALSTGARLARHSGTAALVVTWGLAVWLCVLAVVGYGSSPGASQPPPSAWPEASALQPVEGGWTLVMFAHPKCPCTRASVAELARIMGRLGNRVGGRVAFLHPSGRDDQWLQSGTWHATVRIPGVTVTSDPGGREARRFSVQTSGHCVLFDPTGAPRYFGGITSGRGHEGTNPGATAIVELVLGTRSEPLLEGAVFGCLLHGPVFPGEEAP